MASEMTDQERITRLREALENARLRHRYCEDSWYSCPKAPEGCADEREGPECNCGADKHNAQIDEVLRETTR